MAMSIRDKDYLDSLPIRRMHVKGGGMTFSGLRILENQISNTGRLAYTQNGLMQGIDKKIQWKMFDRERDFCWQSNAQAGTALETDATGKVGKGVVRTYNAYNADILTAHPFRKDANVLGQVGTWDARSLPQAYMCGENANMATASRVYEMMKDHPIGDGRSLSFPIMGHPFPISVGRKDGVSINLFFTTARYPGTTNKPSDLVGASFVNWQACDIATYIRNQRIARCSSTNVCDKDIVDGTNSGLLRDSVNHTVTSLSCAPTYFTSKLKCDDVTSSHYAVIHVPQFPLQDGKVELAVCIADVSIETIVEVDIAKIRNGDYDDHGILGEIWDDTVDPSCNPFIPAPWSLAPDALVKNRENWYTSYWQYCIKANLDKAVVISRAANNVENKVPWIRGCLVQGSGQLKNGIADLGEDRNNNYFNFMDLTKYAQ